MSSGTAAASGTPTKRKKSGVVGKIVDLFTFSSHETMERMRNVVMGMVITGVIIAGGSGYAASVRGISDISRVASYASEFTTSKTQQQGTIDGVYRNADGTKAMVMMTMASPREMPSSADDYYVYVSGMKADGKATKVAQASAGGIYSFGDTGVFGVMLAAPEGFSDSQLLNLTIRANRELVPTVELTEEQRINRGWDETFALWDQWRVVINPIADEAIHARSLDAENPDPRDMYIEMVATQEEASIRRKLDGHLGKMHATLSRLDSYNDRLERTRVRIDGEDVRIAPPMLPEELIGDEMEGMSSAELSRELDTTDPESIPDVAYKSIRARELDTYDDGYMVNTYRLQTNRNVAGGLNFDWRPVTLEDGYSTGVVPAGTSILDFLLARPSADQAPDLRNEAWVLTNGQPMEELPRGDESTRSLLDLRNNLIQSYGSYWKLKNDYQRLLLPELLLLEQRVDEVADNVDIATGVESVEFRL